MKPKKIAKIIIGVIVFFTLPSLLFFGYVYLKYDEDLPIGTKGEQAEQMATKMLSALDYEAYKNTNYIEWTFKNRHHYQWKKNEETCTVHWEDYKVDLNLNEYFEIMVECITEQGGMLDKFIGDAIMAAFGLPITHEDDEDRGVKAGIKHIVLAGAAIFEILGLLSTSLFIGFSGMAIFGLGNIYFSFYEMIFNSLIFFFISFKSIHEYFF